MPWPMDDVEYTPSSSTLSAIWPVLRHDTYAWKVVSDDVIRRFAYVVVDTAPDYDDYDCSALEVLSCGETNVRNQSINIQKFNPFISPRFKIKTCL